MWGILKQLDICSLLKPWVSYHLNENSRRHRRRKGILLSWCCEVHDNVS